MVFGSARDRPGLDEAAFCIPQRKDVGSGRNEAPDLHLRVAGAKRSVPREGRRLRGTPDGSPALPRPPISYTRGIGARFGPTRFRACFLKPKRQNRCGDNILPMPVPA